MEPEKKQEATTDEGVSRQPKRTLFVRSLPASATSDSLAENFSQSYVIKHAIVVTDPQTQQSKGFGFVTFADIEDAQRALEEFNGSVFDGKKIKVDYAEARHREVDENIGKSVPSASHLKKREQEKAAAQPPKLIVRNLPWSIKESSDLEVLFRSFGKVKQAVLPKKGNALAGFGFVVLRGKKNAEKALEAINGKEVDGRTLAVDWAVDKNVWEDLRKQDGDDGKEEKEEKSSDVEMADGSEGLETPDGEAPSDDDEDEDDEDMEEDEDLEDDDEDFEDEDAEDDGGEQEDERNASTVFIRNLPFTCTDETLYEHFTQFGSLRYARIVVDPETDRPRGTGFVCFWRPEDSMSCVREAPRQQDPATNDKEKEKGKKASAVKHSVLQNETTDPSGRYTLDGRVLQVARAVSKTKAAKLEEDGVLRRLVRDTDKRRLFLLSEGTVPETSPLYKQLTPSEIKMREDSFKQRQSFIKKNPTLHLSLTRLSIRNIPRTIDSKDLKQLARQGVVGFAEEAKKGLRQPLSKEEVMRTAEAMKEAEKLRKRKGQGVVRQAKIVFEGREGSKVDEKSGAGRSRGYGFVEYFTHRHALMGLRWLNGHAVDAPTKAGAEDEKDKKKRLVVEFAIENAQVLKRRSEQQERSRNFVKARQQNDETSPKDADRSKGRPLRNRDDKFKGRPSRNNDDKFKGKPSRNNSSSNSNSNNDDNENNKKRKRSESRNSDKGQGGDGADSEEANKVAKRNRIISRKRMQRKGRKGKA